MGCVAHHAFHCKISFARRRELSLDFRGFAAGRTASSGLCAAEGGGVAENLHPVSGRVKRFPGRFWPARTETGSTDSRDQFESGP